MKRFLVIILAGLMLFSFAACGNNETPSGGKETVPISQGDLDDPDDALDKLEQMLPDGWDENKYGAYIYNVWDSEFLPDCFPAAPDGIKVDQTNFKDYDHDTLNGSNTDSTQACAVKFSGKHPAAFSTIGAAQIAATNFFCP